MELAGKVIIVNGAAGSLGSACTRELARQGAKVLAADLPGTRLDALVAEIAAEGGTIEGCATDISDEPQVIAMVERARATFGEADVLVNVAAAIGHLAKDHVLEDMTPEWWDETFAINVRGPMLCAKHVLPAMRARGSGVILNFGSSASFAGDVGMIAYSTAKAGLVGLTRAIATTYGKDGVRCNIVCPGSVWNMKVREGFGDKLDLMERTRLTPRLGEPEDVAYMVAFLSSDRAAYLTGQTFLVDGGGLAHQPWVRMK